jgi:hypothetical protein
MLTDLRDRRRKFVCRFLEGGGHLGGFHRWLDGRVDFHSNAFDQPGGIQSIASVVELDGEESNRRNAEKNARDRARLHQSIEPTGGFVRWKRYAGCGSFFGKQVIVDRLGWRLFSFVVT